MFLHQTIRRLHGDHAEYVVHEHHRVLSFIDKDPSKPVAGNIAALAADIDGFGVPFNQFRAICKDAAGTWQLIVMKDGAFERFVALNETDEAKARSNVLAMKVLPP